MRMPNVKNLLHRYPAIFISAASAVIFTLGCLLYRALQPRMYTYDQIAQRKILRVVYLRSKLQSEPDERQTFLQRFAAAEKWQIKTAYVDNTAQALSTLDGAYADVGENLFMTPDLHEKYTVIATGDSSVLYWVTAKDNPLERPDAPGEKWLTLPDGGDLVAPMRAECVDFNIRTERETCSNMQIIADVLRGEKQSAAVTRQSYELLPSAIRQQLRILYTFQSPLIRVVLINKENESLAAALKNFAEKQGVTP